MFKKSILTAALAIAVSGSFAQVYVEGAIGQGSVGATCPGSCSKKNTGTKFVAGYDLGKGWSVEGLVIDYGKVTATNSPDLKVSGLGIGGAYLHSLNDKWSLKASLALTQMKVSSIGSETSLQPNIGLGVGYKLTATLAGIAQYDFGQDKYNGSKGSQGLLSIGLRASF